MKTLSSPRCRRRGAASLLALLALLLPCHAVCAQYSIDWSTIDGGGGTAAGGPYALSGTVGQPDAAAMGAGQYAMHGGFWPGLIVPSAGEAPTLFIQLAGDSVIISWSPETPGFELEAASDLTGAVWSVGPAGNPVAVGASGMALFYRLRKP